MKRIALVAMVLVLAGCGDPNYVEPVKNREPAFQVYSSIIGYSPTGEPIKFFASYSGARTR